MGKAGIPRLRYRFLYAVQVVKGDATNGPIKVGHSQDVRSRKHNLQSANPEPLRLIGVATCAAPQRYESILKSALLLPWKIRGEWFTPGSLAILGHIGEPIFLAVVDGMYEWGVHEYDTVAKITRTILRELK